MKVKSAVTLHETSLAEDIFLGRMLSGQQRDQHRDFSSTFKAALNTTGKAWLRGQKNLVIEHIALHTKKELFGGLIFFFTKHILQGNHSS